MPLFFVASSDEEGGGPGEGQEEGEEAPKEEKFKRPDLAIFLAADDAFLRERIINRPESVVAGTNNREKEFLKRLAAYRALNARDSNVHAFLDELELGPTIVGRRNCDCNTIYIYIRLFQMQIVNKPQPRTNIN